VGAVRFHLHHNDSWPCFNHTVSVAPNKFFEAFAEALQNCDALLLAPVYAAGEPTIPGVCSNALAQRIRSLRPDLEIEVAENLNQLTDLVKQRSRP
jgi:UDP-N-acetylmuramate--alanine ligase